MDLFCLKGVDEDDDDNDEESAITSDVMPGDGNVLNESDMTEDGEGTDGVTSEGEKVQACSSEAVDVEEGREAEASTSIKLRNREVAPQTPHMREGQSNRRGPGRHSRRAITWSDNGRRKN